MKQLRAAMLLLWCMAACGCAARLPTYPAMDAKAALAVVADRLESVRTVSAAAGMTFAGADGRSVRLEGAMAARPPRTFRLRAWKFNTAVFDLTVVGEEAWLMQSERTGARGMGDVPAASIMEAMALMGEPYFRSAEPLAAHSDAEVLTVTAPGPGGVDAVCEIDRASLAPRLFRMGDASIALDRYRVIDGTPWAMRWRFRGPQGEVVLRLRDVELNRALPAGAFTPSRRAVRLAP